MKKISEIFGMTRSQNELDFIDIDIDTDIELFVDPYRLSKYNNEFCVEASSRVNSFFVYLIELLIAKKYDEAEKVFSHVGEVNETCLGLSKGKPRGNGIGPENTKVIFEELKKSKAVKNKVVENIEDLRLFIKGVDRDKISDMTTNIIREILIKYTQNQCKLYNFSLTPNIHSGFYWNYITRSWEDCLTDMLVINGKIYLLVPKIAVSYSDKYTSSEFYNKYALNFLQEENIRKKTSLVQFRKNKEPFVTKKSIDEKNFENMNNNDSKKEWLINFAKAYPNVFKNFKDNAINSEKEPTFNENRAEIARFLIDELKSIKKGSDYASEYHNLIICILEFIYYPNICNPEKEYEEHEGRKRIDIVYNNSANSKFFFDLMNKFNIPANFIIVECKNYSKDVNNPELDQLSGRFSCRRGKFGLMLCRDVNDMDKLLERCADTYKDDRGLIIPIVDNDIIGILNDISNEEENDGLNILLSRYKIVAFK